MVLAALYSIFTEGYAASSGEHLQRPDLAEEAIRLTRILHRLMPAEREVSGLLALMLLVHARRDARTDPSGAVMLLDAQDRARWDRAMIEEGSTLVVAALTGGPPGPYGVQAAIAALHDEASDVDSTDWPQIVALYDVLTALSPSPIVALNRAVAVAMRDGSAAGLELLDGLAEEPSLRDYGPYVVARASCWAGSAGKTKRPKRIGGRSSSPVPNPSGATSGRGRRSCRVRGSCDRSRCAETSDRDGAARSGGSYSRIPRGRSASACTTPDRPNADSVAGRQTVLPELDALVDLQSFGRSCPENLTSSSPDEPPDALIRVGVAVALVCSGFGSCRRLTVRRRSTPWSRAPSRTSGARCPRVGSPRIHRRRRSGRP